MYCTANFSVRSLNIKVDTKCVLFPSSCDSCGSSEIGDRRYILLCIGSTVRSAAMTPDDVTYRFRVRTFALARELGSVRAACGAMDIHHSNFYRWRSQVRRFGLETLRPR